LPTNALLVDDEQHLRMYLKLILKQVGFTNFYEAVNGEEAVELYKAHKPDLVLMDVNMPKKEGMEALQDIMAFDEEAVVIMTTSVASREAVQRSAELGATHYIRKDTPKDDMIAMLQEIVDEIWGD
jgi:Response regulator containing CheY-like receiver domain and AraC-type DNA-binding domain